MVEVADVDVVGEQRRLTDLDVDPAVDGVADADDRLAPDAQRALVGPQPAAVPEVAERADEQATNESGPASPEAGSGDDGGAAKVSP